MKMKCILQKSRRQSRKKVSFKEQVLLEKFFPLKKAKYFHQIDLQKGDGGQTGNITNIEV